jgi:hypothetical protein
MSTFLLKIEAIEARVASYSCPRGTVGRVHAIRLRRRFQAPNRSQSTAILGYRDWDLEHQTSSRDVFDNGQREGLRQRLVHDRERSAISQPESELHNESLNPEFIPEDITSVLKGGVQRPSLKISQEERALLRRLPPHLARASYGDTFGLPYPEHQFKNSASALDEDPLHDSLQGEDPHALLKVLTGLTRSRNGEIQGHRILGNVSPTTFTEILRSLDPKDFVGRYVDLHRQISSRNSPYTALQPRKEGGMHQFRLGFIARIRAIIDARRSRGFALSVVDYKYLLRCIRAVGNPRALRAVWNAMERDGTQPDTECYNHYIGTKVWSDMYNSTHRQKIRVVPKFLAFRQTNNPPPGFRGQLIGPGIGVKYETSTMFDGMVQLGVMGDEETFSLLLIALAREGDLEGMKGIMMKVWGIDVDQLMTKDESKLPKPKHFPLGSPFRPSQTLLLAIAHAFGINNEIPVALRLIDYLSRHYSIGMPQEVAEELLERTFVLSRRRTLKERGEGMDAGQLPPEAVSNLWSALSAESFGIKPTMTMYDKLITNLLDREKFKEVEERMDEALKIHVKSVRQHHQTLAVIRLKASLISGQNQSQGHKEASSSTTSQSPADLEKDKAYQELLVHRSRQYIRRWCRLFIHSGSKSLEGNLTFSAVTLPNFMQKYLSFMPRNMEYLTSSGEVVFSSGSKAFNREFIQDREVRKSTREAQHLRKTRPLPRSLGQKNSKDTLPPILESEEMFGKS